MHDHDGESRAFDDEGEIGFEAGEKADPIAALIDELDERKFVSLNRSEVFSALSRKLDVYTGFVPTAAQAVSVLTAIWTSYDSETSQIRFSVGREILERLPDEEMSKVALHFAQGLAPADADKSLGPIANLSILANCFPNNDAVRTPAVLNAVTAYLFATIDGLDNEEKIYSPRRSAIPDLGTEIGVLNFAIQERKMDVVPVLEALLERAASSLGNPGVRRAATFQAIEKLVPYYDYKGPRLVPHRLAFRLGAMALVAPRPADAAKAYAELVATNNVRRLNSPAVPGGSAVFSELELLVRPQP